MSSINLELKRQGIHLLVGLILIAFILFSSVLVSAITFSFLLVCGIILSGFLSNKKQRKTIKLFDSILNSVERKNELEIPGCGVIIFFIGALIALFLFQEKLLVISALTVLVFGDSASTLIGTQFGKTKIKTKMGWRSLEGSIAFFVVSSIALSFLINPLIALPVCFIGMLCEYLPINDNLLIPFVSGIALKLLLILL